MVACMPQRGSLSRSAGSQSCKVGPVGPATHCLHCHESTLHTMAHAMALLLCPCKLLASLRASQTAAAQAAAGSAADANAIRIQERFFFLSQ